MTTKTTTRWTEHAVINKPQQKRFTKDVALRKQCDKNHIFIRHYELVRTFSRSRKINISTFFSFLFLFFHLQLLYVKIKSHKILQSWLVLFFVSLLLNLFAFCEALLYLMKLFFSRFRWSLWVCLGCLIKITLQMEWIEKKKEGDRYRTVWKRLYCAQQKDFFFHNENNV